MRAVLRWGMVGFASAVGVYVAAALLVPRVVDVDRLRSRAESRLSDALGRPVTLGRLRLSLWAGPSVGADGLTIAGEPAVEARRARIHAALGPLLRGDLRPRGVELEGGRVTRRSRPLLEEVSVRTRVRGSDAPVRLIGRLEGRAVGGGESANVALDYDATVAPRRVDVASATVTVGGSVFVAQGFVQGRGDGTLDVRLEGDGRLGGLALRRLAATGAIDQDALSLDSAEFELYGGRGTASGRLRLDEPAMPFVASAHVDGARVEAIVEALAPGYGDVIEGAVTATLDVEGYAAGASRKASLRGPIHGEITDGTLKSVALLRQAARLIEMAGGRGIGRDETPFRSLAASLMVRDGVATTDALTFRSEDLDLDGGGSIGLDGTLRLAVLSSFSREASAELVERTPQLRFRVDPSGRLTLPMRIRGTLRSPVVQIDIDRVLQEGLQQELRRGGRKGWLRQLLGRN